MTSRLLLSSSSGCRGVARLKMGSIALTRQNKRSESGDNMLVCERVTTTGYCLTFQGSSDLTIMTADLIFQESKSFILQMWLPVVCRNWNVQLLH